MKFPIRACRWPRVADAAIAVGISTAFFAVLVWVLREPVYPSDEIAYFHAASTWPDTPGFPSLLPWGVGRVGLLWPVKGALVLFGYSQVGYYAIPFLAGALMLSATYVLGRMLFGPVVGILASTVLFANPLLVTEWSDLQPDILAAGLFTTAFCLAVYAGRRNRKAALDKPAKGALIAVGALIGWSWLTREYTVFLFPLLGVLLLHYRLRRRHWLLVAAPALGLLTVEIVVNAAVHGDALYRFRKSAEFAPDATRWFYEKRLAGQPLLLAPVLTLIVDGGGFDALKTHPESVGMVGLLALTVIAGAWTRDRRVLAMGAWILLLYVPLVLLGGVLANKVNVLKPRYWFEIYPAIAVGGIGGAAVLARRILSRRVSAARLGTATALVPAALALVVVSGFLTALPIRSGTTRLGGATQLESLRSWLSTRGRGIDTLWTGGRTAQVLPIYLNTPFGSRVWRGSIKILDSEHRPSPADVAHRSAVVLYGARGRTPCKHCRLATLKALGDPPAIPPAWRLQAANRDGSLEIYAVGDR